MKTGDLVLARIPQADAQFKLRPALVLCLFFQHEHEPEQNRTEGTLKWNIHGQDRAIAVEEYDSYGEACFRLQLVRPRT